MPVPPKCKTCGKSEWHHTCGPALTIEELTRTVMAAPHSLRMKAQVAAMDSGTNAPALRALLVKPSRKEYLKLKARERRARQKGKTK